jgi:hypothetical protein
MKVLAEIKKVSSKKLASLDIEYQIVLSTNDSSILDLGKLPADTMVELEIKTVS